MPSLYVRCHSCGDETATGLGVTEESAMKSLTMVGVLVRCSVCGEVDKYVTPEFHIPTRELQDIATRVDAPVAEAAIKAGEEAIPPPQKTEKILIP
jgi:uncharacterized Zn finger protein